MLIKYDVINATQKENNIINTILQYIYDNYSEKFCFDRLKRLEVIDELTCEASGECQRDTIKISRKDGLNEIGSIKNIDVDIKENRKIKILVSTIYHELWHISTWTQYEEMYEYAMKPEDADMYVMISYIYWIEYIAHKETVFMECDTVMRDYCQAFVTKQWQKIDYGYLLFIKALPYYIVRSQYLKIYEDLTEEIKSTKLKAVVKDFGRTSEKIYGNQELSVLEKAKVIENMIRDICEK